MTTRREPASMGHRLAVVALCAVVLASCLVTGAVAGAPTAAVAAASAVVARSGASAPHMSPYVLAARRHAQEAASEPIKVNPMNMHRQRTPRATGRG